MNKEVVYKNKWMSVNMSKNPDGGHYYFFEESSKVVILPYLYYLNKPKIVCLLEPVSTWGNDKELTAVTGSIEYYESPEKACVRELEEEVGVRVPFGDKWTELGEFNVSKSLSSKRYHYLVDITNSEFGKRKTDGSYFEKSSKIFVTGLDKVDYSTDLSFHFLVLSLRNHLNIY